MGVAQSRQESWSFGQDHQTHSFLGETSTGSTTKNRRVCWGEDQRLVWAYGSSQAVVSWSALYRDASRNEAWPESRVARCSVNCLCRRHLIIAATVGFLCRRGTLCLWPPVIDSSETWSECPLMTQSGHQIAICDIIRKSGTLRDATTTTLALQIPKNQVNRFRTQVKNFLD